MRERLLTGEEPQPVFRILEQDLTTRLKRPLLINPAIAHALATQPIGLGSETHRRHSARSGIQPRHFIALFRVTEPSGRIGHAEIKLGPTTVMLSDEYPEHGIRGPRSLGGTTFSIHLHVGDVDAAFEQAVSAGASVVRPLQNHFYGERSGTVRDPFGHEWLLGGHLETVTTEEMQRRHTACQKIDFETTSRRRIRSDPLQQQGSALAEKAASSA